MIDDQLDSIQLETLEFDFASFKTCVVRFLFKLKYDVKPF